eukprot:9475967-Pyramimonas_sp.AAC.1
MECDGELPRATRQKMALPVEATSPIEDSQAEKLEKPAAPVAAVTPALPKDPDPKAAPMTTEQQALAAGKMPKGVQAALDHLKQNNYDVSKMSQQDLQDALPPEILKRAFAGFNYKLSTVAPNLHRRYEKVARSLELEPNCYLRDPP